MVFALACEFVSLARLIPSGLVPRMVPVLLARFLVGSHDCLSAFYPSSLLPPLLFLTALPAEEMLPLENINIPSRHSW